MLTIEELPIAIQTIFADLVHRAWTGNLSALTSQGGSAYTREARGKLYWYWQPPTAPDGNRPSAKYIGPDNDQTRAHLQQLKDHVENIHRDGIWYARFAPHGFRFPTGCPAILWPRWPRQACFVFGPPSSARLHSKHILDCSAIIYRRVSAGPVISISLNFSRSQLRSRIRLKATSSRAQVRRSPFFSRSLLDGRTQYDAIRAARGR